MQIEEWRDIPGYAGLYQASNLGNIRRLATRFIDKNGKQTGRKGCVLKQGVKPAGHRFANLSKEGKVKNYYIHRLVYSAFYGEICSGMDIDHIDRDPGNNNIANLRLCTHSDNLRNQGVNKHNKLGYKGVHKNINGTFTCRVGEKTHTFRTLIDAIARYDIEAIREYGEYAVTNESLGLVTKGELDGANPYYKFRPKSGYKGVSEINKGSGCYRFIIGINGKQQQFSGFRSAIEAALAYDKKAVEIYGPNAKTNASLGYL